MPEWFDTWYQPALGALHVLGIAWFGASLWSDAPRLRRMGVAWLVATGVALFAVNADRVWASTSFRIKLALLIPAVLVSKPRWLVWALWGAIVFASRGIAYF